MVTMPRGVEEHDSVCVDPLGPLDVFQLTGRDADGTWILTRFSSCDTRWWLVNDTNVSTRP